MEEQMKELLERYNYHHFGHCNCDGFPTDKYRAGDFELRLREKKNLFKIKRLGHSITGWESVSNLQQTLQNIHQNVAV